MNKQELIEEIKNLANYNASKRTWVNRGVVLELVEQLNEPQKPVVPQFVADWYEEHKDDFEIALFRCIDHIPSVYDEGDLNEFEEWIIDGETKPFQTLVNMHQFGYEVKEEKRYLVKMKGMSEENTFLTFRFGHKWILSNFEECEEFRLHHTRKELEEDGFGEVFKSPLFEIEEVQG